MFRKLIYSSLGGMLGLSVVAAGLITTPAVANDGIKEIIERGVLRAGVRTTKKAFRLS